MSSVPKNDTLPSKQNRPAPAQPGNIRLREVDPKQWSAQNTSGALEAAEHPPTDRPEPAVRFYRERSNENARSVLKASVVYIPALLALISLDKLV